MKLLPLLVLTFIPSSTPLGYSYGLAVNRNHMDTCESAADQEALRSIAEAVIEKHLYRTRDEDGEDSDDDSRRKLRGSTERDLTTSCDNRGYCQCPNGGGCSSYWCCWCTRDRRRLYYGSREYANASFLERQIEEIFVRYQTEDCHGEHISVNVELERQF